MKTKRIFSLLLGALVLTGCGKKEEPNTAQTAAAAGPKTFELTANDTMKYNLTRLEVNAGEDVKIILTNTGVMPKQAMAHNWILLKAGADAQAYANVAITAIATDYFPTQLADQVVAHTKLLGPKQSDEITFKAPAQPGEYPFLCSFPAHYAAGMKGVLVVK